MRYAVREFLEEFAFRERRIGMAKRHVLSTLKPGSVTVQYPDGRVRLLPPRAPDRWHGLLIQLDLGHQGSHRRAPHGLVGEGGKVYPRVQQCRRGHELKAELSLEARLRPMVDQRTQAAWLDCYQDLGDLGGIDASS